MVLYQPWISLLIMQELKKIEPSLKLKKIDKRVLEICCEDFRNYIDYLHAVGEFEVPLMFDISTEVEVDLHTGEFRIVNSSEGEEMKETVEFIVVWTRMWWKKWKERVQLALKKSSLHTYKKIKEDQKKGATMLWKFSEEERNDIIKATRNMLIKNGEICCTEIIANSLLKVSLGKRENKQWNNDEEKINLMIMLRQMAKRMSYTHGPLVFIKLDSRYYRLGVSG